MEEIYSSNLITSISEVHNFLLRLSQKNESGQSISYEERRLLNEGLETVFWLTKLKVLSVQDSILLERAFRFGENVIFEKLLHFGNYYYSKQKLIRGNFEEKEKILRRTNVETASFLSRVRAFQLKISGIGGSTDDYFVERLPQLLKGISYAIDKNLTGIYIPIIYNLCNLHQTIIAYQQSGHNKYDTDALFLNIIELLKSALNKRDCENLLNKNLQLKFFVELQRFLHAENYDKKYTIPDHLALFEMPAISIEYQLRLLTSFYFLCDERFITLFESFVSEHARKLYSFRTIEQIILARCLGFYLHSKKNAQRLECGIRVPTEKIRLRENLNKIFNGFDQVEHVVVNKHELELLLGYNDNTLREKVAKTIRGVPQAEIEREMRKPHGVFEIADMELRVEIDGKDVYLCMPFKSGKEITSKSVPVNVMYQITRPFVHFDSCAVVFITAKRASENLMNEIKRTKDKLGFAVEVLEYQELAKVIKYNGVLN